MKQSARPHDVTSPLPGRASRSALERARRRVLLDRLLVSLIEAIPDYAMVLNRERQIIAANSRLRDAFGLADEEAYVGKRAGELLGCIFALDGPDGCGTSAGCTACGAVRSLLECERTNSQTVAEFHVTTGGERLEAHEFEVVSTPVTLDDFQLIVCAMKDISADKRRSALERLFFHDLMNAAGGIHGLASLLVAQEHLPPTQEAEYHRWLVSLAEGLIDEIGHQRRLLAAERGEFQPDLGMVNVSALVDEVLALYSRHTVADGRTLRRGEIANVTVLSDRTILRRILGNLVKNALEAVSGGETVTVSARLTNDEVTFVVHNPGVIPEPVQLQLFQRSFSTKGESGRGLGTYSVKLFAEGYLHGRVTFTSCVPEGTTFTVTIPHIFPSA